MFLKTFSTFPKWVIFSDINNKVKEDLTLVGGQKGVLLENQIVLKKILFRRSRGAMENNIR